MRALEPARLIPVAGIKGAQEAEDRATSALLAVLMIVRPFNVSLLSHAGVKRVASARVEAFIGPVFTLGDRKAKPDGLVEVHVGKRTAFRALVEVKTGTDKLDADQINTYLDVAREQGMDCVITISNEIAPSPGVHPTAGLRVRSNSKVSVHHLSWTLILSEAVKERDHRGVDDPEQAWILNELIRYLTHPKSGVTEFSDMGENWPQVRYGATHGTLNKTDPAAAEVCQRWDQLLRVAALRLSTETGADVQEVIPKSHRDHPQMRGKAFVDSLCGAGTLTGVLRVPDAAADAVVTADIRASIVEVSAVLAAPDDGTPRAAVVWLSKQLRDAPGGLVVDTYAKHRRTATSETLERLREDPLLALGNDRRRHPSRFVVRLQSPMGEGRRSTRKKGFIDSVLDAVVSFYATVLQDIAPFAPRAPHIERPARSTATASPSAPDDSVSEADTWAAPPSSVTSTLVAEGHHRPEDSDLQPTPSHAETPAFLRWGFLYDDAPFPPTDDVTDSTAVIDAQSPKPQLSSTEGATESDVSAAFA